MADDDYTEETAPVETPTEGVSPADDTAKKKEELLKLWEAAQAQVQLPDGIQSMPLPGPTELPPKDQSRPGPDSGGPPTLAKEQTTDVPDIPPTRIDPVEPLPLEPPPSSKIRMLSTTPTQGKKFSPEVEAAIDEAARKANVDPKWLRAIAHIESAGNPLSNINKGTQYKGLFQIGTRGPDSEWQKTGQGRDPFSAQDNAMAMARLLNRNRQDFIRVKGREPTADELYLMHQQGLGFFTPGIKRGQDAAGITNARNNMPPGAGPGAASSRDAFLQAWANRIRQVQNSRGAGPTASIVEPNQPSSMLSSEPLATTKVPLEGGTPDTPQAQAMIATLMHGMPLASQRDPATVAQEAATAEAQRPRYKGRVLPRTATTSETQQVQGQELPTPGVTHTDTLPIPGVGGISGPQALMNQVGPSLQSTIASYPRTIPSPPVKDQINQGPGLIDRIMSAVKSITPTGAYDPSAKNAAVAELLSKPPTPETSVSDWLRSLQNPDIETNPDNPWYGLNQAASGFVGGAAHMPTDLLAMGTGIGAGAAGLASGNDVLKTIAAKAAPWAEERRKEALKAVGLNPDNMTPTASGAEVLGQSMGPNAPMTALNLGMAAYGHKILGPASQYLAEKLPIPDLSLTTPAQAATAFGKPPLVVNTPNGPVVMNDAELQGMVWGGALAMGFGWSVANAGRVIPWAASRALPYSWTDPRREVTGAPRTIAGSIPEDFLKGATLDRTQALLDAANRQTKYDSATHTGIDPVASDLVYQKWRVQTGAQAQNLIANALTEGKLNTEDYRFNVDVPIKEISKYSDANPMFGHYIKMRMIEDELNYNAAQQKGLPKPGTQPKPNEIIEPDGTKWGQNTATNERQRIEADNPDFVTWHKHYQDNLAEARRFTSDHQTRNTEDPKLLAVAAAERPSFPIVSERANTTPMLDRVLGGESPLYIAEQNISKGLAAQMKWDAESHYMDIAPRDAFTPRTKQWVNSTEAAAARSAGAILKRIENGVSQYYTADPLIVSMMNADHIPLSSMGKFFTPAKFKGWFQTHTTGKWAPWFAPTGSVRAMEQGWTTAPGGIRDAAGYRVLPAGPLSMARALPPLVGAQLAKYWAPKVEFFSELLRQKIPSMDTKYVDLMARTLQKAYNDSFYKRMKDVGAYSGETLQQAKEIHDTITAQRLQNKNPTMQPVHNFMTNSSEMWQRFIATPTKAVGKGFKALGRGIDEGLRDIQELPNYAWAYKVGKNATDTARPTITKGGTSRPMSDAEIAARMRNYTGDPSTRGYLYETGPGGKRQMLNTQFTGFTDLTNRVTAMGRAKTYRGVAAIADTARAHIPWSGVLIQSPANTIRMLRENPVRANLAFAASAVMPEMVAYLWNAYHSNDKYDYVNHMMNGQSDYDLMNGTYWATPGEPPQNGVSFKQYQETILARYMTRAFMHQYNGKSMTTMGEDTWRALMGFLKGAVIPPQPSWYTALLATQGMVNPEGWLGNTYKRRNNEYITLGGGENPVELTIRAIAPAVSDMSIAAMTAGLPEGHSYADIPGDVLSGKVDYGAAARQVGKRAAQRTFILGNMLGYTPNVAGSTELSEELWKRKHTIDDLMYRYKAYDLGHGDVSMQGASKKGSRFVQNYMGDLPPTEKGKVPNPGRPQPEPNNPLYKMLMGQIATTFGKDDPSKGGIGFKSMWKDYAAYGTLAGRMRTVNEGNAGVWRAEQEKKPKMNEYLQKNNVDPNDYKQVRDFFNARRNDAAQKILYTIQATEQKLDQLPAVRSFMEQNYPKGTKFSIDLVDPRKPGIQKPDSDAE